MIILPSASSGTTSNSLFKPTNISNLDLWLDAADPNTLYDATSGGNLVTTDGGSVKRWEDKGPNKIHATENTSPPLLELSEKNGRNALNFATSRYLTCSFTSKTFTAETVFAVFRYNSSSPSYGRIFTQSVLNSNDYSISNHYIPILKNATNNEICSWADSSVRSIISVSDTTWYIARARHSGSALTVKLNITEGSNYSHILNRNFEFYRIGATYTGPSGGTDSEFANSLISEIIVYTKSLTDDESNLVTNYLNNKWAIY